MIVKDKRLNGRMSFKDVNIGSLFLYHDNYYLRVMSSMIPENNCRFNAINLESGYFVHIDVDDEILQLEGEIIVR